MSQRNRPIFLLKRLEHSARFRGMLLRIFPNAHLIVKKGVRTALDHFQNGGGFLFQREDRGIFDIGPRPDLARRALANGERFPRLVEILLGLDRAVARHEKRKAGRQVGIGKSDGSAAFGRIRHRRNDAIDLVGLEGRNQPGEGNVFNTHRLAEKLSESLGNVHADALGFSRGANRFKGWIREIHPHDQGVFVATPAGGKQKDSHREQRGGKGSPRCQDASHGLDDPSIFCPTVEMPSPTL